MRISKGLMAALLILVVLVLYAFIDGGREELHPIEEKLSVQSGPEQ